MKSVVKKIGGFFRPPDRGPAEAERSEVGTRLESDFSCPPPSQFFLETGNICNLRCPFCGTGLRRKGTQRGFLRKTDFAVILAKISPYTDHLSFYNYGEPFLNPEFLEMVAMAREQGINCSTHSNLTVTEFDEAAARAVVDSGLIFLSASIDGASQETYGRYRIGGSFERALKNLEKLQRMKEQAGSSTPRLVWKFLINRFNEHEQERARRLAAEIGVEIEFHLMDVWGNEEWKSSLHRKQEVWGKEREISRVAAADAWPGPHPLPVDLAGLQLHPGLHYWCEQPFTAMVINWNGEVFPCVTVCDDRFSLGNLLREDLPRLWNSSAYRECRRFLYNYGPRQESTAPCARFECELRHKFRESE
jgi:radical SAM protein with 4Fe4S-binding SPASM domain